MQKYRFAALLCAAMLCTDIISANVYGTVSAASNAQEKITDAVSDKKTDSKLYSVSYDMNGGTGKVTQSEPVATGEEVTLSVWALRREGYSHTCWTDGENVYERGQTIKMPDHNLKLTAVWTALYTLRYEDTSVYGYKLPLDNQTVVPGTEIALKNYAMFNGNAQFNGWRVNGEYYEPRSKFIMPEKDVYVEVDWLDPIRFVLSAGHVEGAIGDGYVEFNKYPGSNFNLPDSTRLARLGYKLTGWVDPVSKEEYRLEQMYVIPDKDTVLEGIWTPIKVLIKFDANGGEGKMDKQIEIYDEIISFPKCAFTKKGYKLLAWKLKDKYFNPDDKFQVKIEQMGDGMDFEAVWIDESVTPGDTNMDGTVDITDLTVLSLKLLGDMKLSDEAMMNADVQKDEKVDLADLALFRQYIMNNQLVLGLKGQTEKNE